ncbi:MAG: hypothetical protein LBE24_10515 [Methylobacillus sp.]|jgi:hypothetical protein|nr:hypothetical protein [Methylobacillus sp.]
MTPDEFEAYEERAAIMEYDAGLSREMAEHLARKFVAPHQPAQPDASPVIGKKVAGKGYEAFRAYRHGGSHGQQT